MNFTASRCSLSDITNFRQIFLQENNFQIRYNACHERNWSDSWMMVVDGVTAGYGSVKGKDNLVDRDAVFEFYLIPAYRRYGLDIFRGFISESSAAFIECQSNDLALSSMLFECASEISSDVVLFHDETTTNRRNPGVVFRLAHAGEKIFAHTVEPPGSHVLEKDGEVVATGGFMLHYNHPFADLYMEVRQDMRRRGYASYLLQEVKKQCYIAGRVPAARCPISNLGSRFSLMSAGMGIAGYMLTGRIKK